MKPTVLWLWDLKINTRLLGSHWNETVKIGVFYSFREISDDSDGDDTQDQVLYHSQTVSQDSGLESDMEVENSVNQSAESDDEHPMSSDTKLKVNSRGTLNKFDKAQADSLKTKNTKNLSINAADEPIISEDKLREIMQVDFSWLAIEKASWFWFVVPLPDNCE